jgi:aminodeoxyfutalosine deaminase
MTYRKFSADRLFTGHTFLDYPSVLVTRSDGTIEDIVGLDSAGDGIETLRGILCPGLVNCHCQLSHLSGLLPQKTGLVEFVLGVFKHRKASPDEILQAIDEAEDGMLGRGIVAVGDICNGSDSLAQKLRGRMLYYNFMEVTGWLPEVAGARFARTKGYLDQFTHALAAPSQSSMSPHASYSVSGELWQLLQPYFTGLTTTTIHNQETPAEDELFLRGTGNLLSMYQQMNLVNPQFQPTGKSSLQSVLPYLQGTKNLLLVHNTCTAEQDLQWLEGTGAPGPAYFFCLCVNANLYIEGCLPDLDLLRKHGCTLVLGTDSLASNHSLDLLGEIKTIMRHYPLIPQAELLQWATLNGARALQLDHLIGSFEKGKRPGVVILEGTQGPGICLDSRARRIL